MTKTRQGQHVYQAPGLEIRRGLDVDIPALITLSKRTLRACYTPFLGKQSVQAWITSTLDAYVRDHVEDAWLASDDGAVCGYCVVKGPLLDLLLVDVRKHGRGIGTRLLDHAEQLLFRTHDEIHLESFAANARANTFYSKRGWIEGERHHDAQSSADVLRFSKRVG